VLSPLPLSRIIRCDGADAVSPGAFMTPRRITLGQMLVAQWRVIFALILRDLKTRWGSTPAYIITFLFPLVHIFTLVGIWVAVGRVAPYGESNVLWFAVSMIPFIIFSYVSRFLLIHVLHNRVLLSFPVIKITDIIFSGVLIEVFNATIVIAIVCFILWLLGVDFWPASIVEASKALAASVLLGLGLGIANALIGIILPMWVTGYFLTIMIIWITSGIMFLPNSLPDYLRDMLYYQPIVHLVEWMREAYYPGYNSIILDKTFVVGCALVFIACGFAIERFARGRIVLQ